MMKHEKSSSGWEDIRVRKQFSSTLISCRTINDVVPFFSISSFPKPRISLPSLFLLRTYCPMRRWHSPCSCSCVCSTICTIRSVSVRANCGKLNRKNYFITVHHAPLSIAKGKGFENWINSSLLMLNVGVFHFAYISRRRRGRFLFFPVLCVMCVSSTTIKWERSGNGEIEKG